MYAIDLGQKIELNSLNKESKIAYWGPQKNLFLFLIIHDNENLCYHIKCPFRESSSSGIQEKAYGFIFSSYSGECKFTPFPI